MPINFDKILIDVTEQEQRKKRIAKRIIRTRVLIDEDGYPTKWAGLVIRLWPFDQPTEWFEFIHDLWYLKSWGWHEKITRREIFDDEEVRQYHISTAGWSGNEYLIEQMEKNWMLWGNTWVQSRRGGHYIFEVQIDDKS
jgi:hypothetical protein